ncbi:MAG: sigma-54-dependent Fis family transcriptional regulator [Phycisphaerae bacterium]|nr:sigma-54-dependent Fis family transcriptional regulator [Phycisphaerae bacterium]
MKLVGHNDDAARSVGSGLAVPAGPRPRVLLVDDDPIVADSLAEFLSREGYAPSTALHAEEALSLLDAAENPELGAEANPFAVVVTDIVMPGMNGLELLRAMSRRFPGVGAVILTAYGTIEQAVEAIRGGAADYLTKPVVESELRLSLERALRQHALRSENVSLRRRLDDRHTLEGIVGADYRMQKVFELVAAVAPTKTTVLMTGESGVGKSLVAHAIHRRSPRKDKPFVELACGSIPETLLESELFGHVKGSFTGAHADKQGKFLAADGGTIFLDEINSASPGMQLKLLRVLQERKFEPVGSNQTLEVDVRVVLASNQPLEQLVAAGTFRQDLYYRINVVKIELPPLRDRVSDVAMLAEHFLKHHAAQLGKALTGFAPDALDALRRYAFPGNVRELQNIIERAAVLTRSNRITIDDLPEHVARPGAGPGPAGEPAPLIRADGHHASAPLPLEQALREPERQIVLAALRAARGNRTRAAEQLGINRTTLYKKMRSLGIDPADADRAA